MERHGLDSAIFGFYREFLCWRVGSDRNSVWAVGTNGTIVKWNGLAWSAQPSGTTEWLRSVWGTDANNIWAVGNNGSMVKWNGSDWFAQNSGTSQHLLGVWGSDSNNVWIEERAEPS